MSFKSFPPKVRAAALALRGLCNEHGFENRFIASELADEAGISRLSIGRIVRSSGFVACALTLGVCVVGVDRYSGYTWISTLRAKQ